MGWSVDFQLVPIVVSYAGIFAVGTIYFFGKRLTKTMNWVIAATATFRTGLVQVREYAESIAFLNATGHENHWATQRLQVIINNLWKIYRLDTYSDTIMITCDRFKDGLHLMILAPAYLLNDTLKAGTLNYAAEGIRNVMQGVWICVKELPRFSKMTASARRIKELQNTFDDLDERWFRRLGHSKCPIQALHEIERLSQHQPPVDSMATWPRQKSAKPSSMATWPGPRTLTRETSRRSLTSVFSPSLSKRSERSRSAEPKSRPEIIIQNCSLEAPGGQPLVQKLNLVVQAGTSVMIMGPSGVGKSSLLRAIAGLWEPKTGSITLPGNNVPMFLPQNVYIPDIAIEHNSLRAQLLFPNEAVQIENEALESVLTEVLLGHLMKPKEGINTTGDWRKRLSGGEKQRIAMARLLLVKPRIAFLDEATSALDDANEARLYRALEERNATYISVGHKMELKKYHSHILELKPGGVWDFYPSSDFELGSRE